MKRLTGVVAAATLAVCCSVCYGIGHAQRSGEDPVKIEVDPAKNRAKEGPRGELDIPGVIKVLKDANYTGFCLVEHETNYDCIESSLGK